MKKNNVEKLKIQVKELKQNISKYKEALEISERNVENEVRGVKNLQSKMRALLRGIKIALGKDTTFKVEGKYYASDNKFGDILEVDFDLVDAALAPEVYDLIVKYHRKDQEVINLTKSNKQEYEMFQIVAKDEKRLAEINQEVEMMKAGFVKFYFNECNFKWVSGEEYDRIVSRKNRDIF